MKKTLFSHTCWVLWLVVLPLSTRAQKLSDEDVRRQINAFKNDPRGPYLRIRWFCDDGTLREPKDPCPEDIGGIQHASYKDVTLKLQQDNHLFFGEILAAAKNAPFWDAANDHSRLKQYQLNRYLAGIDDGWVLRKAQYYRGAVQSEDEQAWGIEFLKWLMADDARLEEKYYLIRQAVKDIPHAGDDNLAQKFRSQSKVISEKFPQFMNLRVKIHGQPDASDVNAVINFKKKYDDKLSDETKITVDALIQTLKAYYAPVDFDELKKTIQALQTDAEVKQQLLDFAQSYDNASPAEVLIPEISDLLCNIRAQIYQFTRPEDRLAVLDLSVTLEKVLQQKSSAWQPVDLKGLLDKIYYLSYATAGTGLLELWEWEAIAPVLTPIKYETARLDELQHVLNASRNVVQWSAAMVKASYAQTVEEYTGFEPLAYGFIDDRVRASVALPLGKAVAKLADIIAKETQQKNTLMQIDDPGTARGLNPGYAKGELVVVTGNTDAVEVQSDKIYLFKRPPSDLKPVAGIATVDEGNLVSHVQLLARNLGIPNAALTDGQLAELAKHNGEEVFYAVSNSGTVILKPAASMSAEERKLFEVKTQERTKIAVPIDQIRLDKKEILNMRSIDASASGKLAGPKAANLGELKKMFPDMVVEGLVIPFGIFREHMSLPMPGQQQTYWDFLNKMFAEAEKMRADGAAENQVESFQLKKLKTLREAIAEMSLKEDFVEELHQSFQKIFGERLGQVPVFLRSDTNMEDLEEFTGAGLNLTIFNVVAKQKIIEGIKAVWASPYTERSFKWRQQYLSNPENVFPSILVIPSVDVDYSGVMITKGINEGSEDDLTVAFSRGAGGAVDGQAAETRLVTATGDRLLAPAREGDYIRLPVKGGTQSYHTGFDQPILNAKNIAALREVASAAREKIPEASGDGYDGAYDIELGFKNDTLYLFQIRPFVENKNALSSGYLESISSKTYGDTYVNLYKPLEEF